MVSRTTLVVILLGLLCVAVPASAHMSMSDPPPLRYKTNPYKTVEDYDYSSPLSPSGSNYPCKGYHKDLGTPSAKSVATWSRGGSYKFQLAGSATHAGGSCQASLSFDRGNTWTLIKSWVGGCVKPEPGGDQTFEFKIPSDVPGGEALFAWTWFNNQGNREMYMNCAVVTISGGKKLRSIPSEGLVTPRASGSSIFLANIGNGCTTVGGKDVAFPNPGSQVEYGGVQANRAEPQGSCGSGPGSMGGGGSASGSGGGSGGSGGNSESCEYWRSQGYHCARAAGRRKLLKEATFLMILVTLAGLCMV
ncbi:hypothetical protein L873DRAFT_1663248 [Choiromyces venosus 120613-1]|uniref:Lytic polysaccharide monooxygenase n=1 Tax=Choiromyces venosus 120613-1 TaxID=1336337 RepID=A0A3N4K8A0_9PEZI|nr:hypothetical protein L873DRAFT_1663248 [Choiromyces venosus 120613-1]